MKYKIKTGGRILLGGVFSILTIFIFSGCQKVINVDLNESTPLIVIEGLVTDRPGPYTVTIRKSGNYFNQPVLPVVSGAVVIITDNTGTIDTLTEKKPGIYLTSKTKGVPGRTYTLKVSSENKEYIGSSTMLSHVGIKTLKIVKGQSQHFGFGGDSGDEINLEIHCFFKDPVEKNFYRIKVSANNNTRDEYYRLYDDQYANGQEIDLRVSHANAGHTYRIELLSLDKKTFGYYRNLEDLLYTNPMFGSTPANPNPDFTNGALGYFGACAISTKTIIVRDSLINALR